MTELNITALNKFNSIINKNKEYIDTQDIDCNDDAKFSMAISMTILEEYHKVSFSDAFNSITDDNIKGKGGDDNGTDEKIDSFYFNDDEDDLNHLILLQAKYKTGNNLTPTFIQDDITLLLSNAIKIAKGEELENPNLILDNKIDDYKEILKQNGSPSIKITVYFATNGKIHLGHKNLSKIEEAKKEGVNCIFIDATSQFGEEEKVSNGNLVVIGEKMKLSENHKIVEGSIFKTSLYELSKFYNYTGEKNLLDDNFRYQIKKSPINKSIKNTVINNPENFIFFNNGISILCKKYGIGNTTTVNKNLNLTEPQIINGGQTITSIYELYQAIEPTNNYEESLKKAQIIIRLYQTDNYPLSKEIAKSTNRQNKIDEADLESNNENQNLVKDYFKLKGIGLLTKKGEPIDYFNDIINNENLLQIYTAFYGENPAKAKLSKSWSWKNYFQKLFSKDTYSDIVKEDLFSCYRINNFLNEKFHKINKKEKEELKKSKNDKNKCMEIKAKYKHEKAILQNSWYSIIYIIGIKEPNTKKINYDLNADHFESIYQETYNIIQLIIKETQGVLGEKFSLNNLFKSNTIKDLIDIKLENKNNEK